MTEKSGNIVFAFDGTSSELAALVGPLEENVRQLETIFSVSVNRRGSRFAISGREAAAAAAVIEECAARILRGGEVSVSDIQMMSAGGHSGSRSVAGTADGIVLRTRRTGLRARTPNQADYLRALFDTDITFGIGPAGTGKTYLAVAAAVDHYERSAVERIVLTRPAIEAGERLGFLPGDLAKKVDPYLRPLYDALFDLLGFDRTRQLIDRQVIEVAPLAYMRGRTLNNAFVILDEAQNTTPEQMKMFLTRIGFGTHAAINGDITQVDLPRGVQSGLAEASVILRDVRGISTVFFTDEDVVRHPLVGAIVRAYARADQQRKAERARHRTSEGA